MTIPPDAPPAAPSPRRPATTVFAWALLALGIPGLGMSLWGLSRVLVGPPGGSGGGLLLDSGLQVLGKCGLLAAGLTLLARSRRAPAAAWAALGLSALGAAHTALVIVPGQAAALEGAAALGYSFGAYSACFASLLLYAAVIAYLRTEAARREFGL